MTAATDGAVLAGRRRTTAAFCSLAACTLGFIYGCSPLVLPVSAALAGRDMEHAQDDYEGGYFLYGTSVLLVLFNASAFVVAFWLPSRPLAAMRSVQASFVMWIVGLLCLALAVQYQLVPLLFVGFVAMAFPLAVIDLYLCHIELPLAWRDGEVHKGMAWLGLSIGLGAIFWTLFLGELTHAFGAKAALWALAAAQGCLLALIQALFRPAALFAERYKGHDHQEHDEVSTCKGQGESATKMNEEERPPLRELIRDWRAWAFCYVICAMTFCGRSIKMLISVIFEHALALSYPDSVRLSAIYLGLYCLGRSITPLFAVRDRIFLLYGGVLAVESIAYGVTPWSLTLQDVRRPVYVVLRLMSGGGFAVLLGNIAVLSVRIFGVARNHQVMGLLMTVEWVSGIGPSFAWALHVMELRSGRPQTESYNAFFWICTAVAASAAACVLALRRAQGALEAEAAAEAAAAEPGAAGSEQEPEECHHHQEPEGVPDAGPDGGAASICGDGFRI